MTNEQKIVENIITRSDTNQLKDMLREIENINDAKEEFYKKIYKGNFYNKFLSKENIEKNLKDKVVNQFLNNKELIQKKIQEEQKYKKIVENIITRSDTNQLKDMLREIENINDAKEEFYKKIYKGNFYNKFLSKENIEKNLKDKVVNQFLNNKELIQKKIQEEQKYKKYEEDAKEENRRNQEQQQNQREKYNEVINKIKQIINNKNIDVKKYFTILTFVKANDEILIVEKEEKIADFIKNINNELKIDEDILREDEFKKVLNEALKEILNEQIKKEEEAEKNITGFFTKYFNKDETEDNQNQQQTQEQVPQQSIYIKKIETGNGQEEEIVNKQKNTELELNGLAGITPQQEEQNENSTQEEKQKHNNCILGGASVVNNTKANSNSSCLFFDKDGRVVENVINDEDKKDIEDYFISKKGELPNKKNLFEVDEKATDFIKERMKGRNATDGAMALVSSTNSENPNEKQLNILMIGNPDIKVILHVTNGKGEKVDWEMTIDEDNNYTIIDENGEKIDPNTLTNIKIPGIHREKSVEIQQEQNQEQKQEEQKQEEQNQEQGQEQSQEEQNKPTVQGSEGENTQKVELNTNNNILGTIKEANEETPINSTKNHVKQLKNKKDNIKNNNARSS